METLLLTIDSLQIILANCTISVISRWLVMHTILCWLTMRTVCSGAFSYKKIAYTLQKKSGEMVTMSLTVTVHF